MTFALAVSAITRHPFSVGASVCLVIVSASLLGLSAALSLAVWAALSLLTVELWSALEPFVVERIGHLRPPTYEESQRLEAALSKSQLKPFVAETSDLIATRGLRCILVGRDYFDLLDDRPLSGLLTEAAAGVHAANLVGYLVVWLGALPLLAVWQLSVWICRLGRLLAVVVGASLVVPLILWPSGFVLWSGRLFGSVAVGLLGAMLLSSGLAAVGLGLLIAWAVVPALAALLAWESRRAERAADTATLDAGFGPQLLEALEFLMVAEPRPHLTGLAGLLCRPGGRPVERTAWLRRTLSIR